MILEGCRVEVRLDGPVYEGTVVGANGAQVIVMDDIGGLDIIPCRSLTVHPDDVRRLRSFTEGPTLVDAPDSGKPGFGTMEGGGWQEISRG